MGSEYFTVRFQVRQRRGAAVHERVATARSELTCRGEIAARRRRQPLLHPAATFLPSP